jgi:H+/Cl- antiporter ClcA
MPGKPLLQPRSSHKARLLALAEWTVLGALVGVVCGSASALFLALLELATGARESQELLVYLLPLAGLGIGAFYERYGKSIRTGNELVIEAMHDETPTLPVRMAPMVLLGTVLTHLFGGSAGREGTAVQMGASLADALAQRLHLRFAVRRDLLAAGVAGGFGSVFGTPLAGAVFALEFAVAGRIEYQSLVPVLLAALVGDLTTRAWGVGHAAYPLAPRLDLSVSVLLKWALFALVIALAAAAFIELTHFLKRQGRRYLPALGMRMFAGGLLVVVLWRLVGSSDYLGLSVPLILRAFTDPSLPAYAFALKLLFTAITLGAGFLGGEVTPLFCIGATLGNVLAAALGLPLELGAGVGMAAMFASASNTPFALSLMAVELLGTNALPHVAIVCVLAYVLSGHRSIYHAQRLFHEKGGKVLTPPLALRDIRRQNERAVRDALRAARAESAAARERLANARERAQVAVVDVADAPLLGSEPTEPITKGAKSRRDEGS